VVRASPGRRTGGPEGCDLIVTVKLLAYAVAQRQFIVPEQLVENSDVVGHQRGLIAIMGSGDLCQKPREC